MIWFHSQSKFCWILKSLPGYYNYHVKYILVQNPYHKTINFMTGTHLSAPQEYLEQFTKNQDHRHVKFTRKRLHKNTF